MNIALHSKDAYKIGHVHQYPVGTQEIYSNLTARSGTHQNVPTSGIVFIGLQYFILDYLIKEWNDTFFNKPKAEVLKYYKRRVANILNADIDISHIDRLHDLGYLPVVIKALPEGSFVPYGVPFLTIKNTLPEFYWVTNLLECVMSAELWLPITSATTYSAYRKLFNSYAELTGVDKSFVPYQGHDFSYRGMAGRHAAAISGMAVLLAGGIGTDNIPAIDYCEEYYFADSDNEAIGQSVSACEHSVSTSNIISNDTDLLAGEYQTLKRLLTEVYPSGIFSYVSDSYDFWGLVTTILPRLKTDIENRDGKLVIRPDSGDPVKIICGYESEEVTPESKGLIENLWDIFGGTTNEAGYKELNPCIGAIYGDSITYDRANKILLLLKEKGFASSNIVLGIGSYTFNYVTRDTHSMTIKTTHAIINDKSIDIFKEPKTDSGTKKSAKGYLMVINKNGEYSYKDECTKKEESHGCLEVIFKDGVLIKQTNLHEIRSVACEKM